MMSTAATRHTLSSTAKAFGAALVVVVALAGCGSSSKGSTTTATTSPGNAGTLLTKALQELVTGQVAQAQTDFEQVLRLDPHNKYAYYNLGYIAQTGGRGTDAQTQYRLALAIDPAYGPALYNLAILRTAGGANAEAIDLYRKAIAADKNDAAARFNLGLLLRKTGKTAEGNAQVAAAVRLRPSLAKAARAQGVPGFAK